MADWEILLITGPAGAGKTTTARRLASQLATPAVHLSLDNARGSVVSGFADPTLGWDAECSRQYGLAQESMAYSAKLYAAAGFKVVIDDAIFPEWEEANLGSWQDRLLPYEPRLFVLMPTLEIAQARNAGRRGGHQLGTQIVDLVYEMMLPWRDASFAVIHNSDLSVEETAALIARDLKV